MSEAVPRVAVLGAGLAGQATIRELQATEDLVLDLVVADRDEDQAAALAASARIAYIEPARVAETADVVVLACSGPGLAHIAAHAIGSGAHVVSVADSMRDVEALLRLDEEAQVRERTIIVGAGFSPGMSGLLAQFAAASFDHVDEVHVARAGTGGPDCARSHHDALGEQAVDYWHGAWVRHRGGSGRELEWFPAPVKSRDCYRAGLPDAWLLQPAFPEADRITARLAANRRDRLTARLPMLRKPHPDGGIGGLRVEVRGRRGKATDTVVVGSVDHPSSTTGAVAAVSTIELIAGRGRRCGAAGVASMIEPRSALAELARRGVKPAIFEGTL